jgi:hypothetical protein
LLVLLHTPLAATVFFSFGKKILHQQFFFCFWKILGPTSTIRVSLAARFPVEIPSVTRASTTREKFAPVNVFIDLFGSSQQGSITQPQKTNYMGKFSYIVVVLCQTNNI